MSLCVLAGEVFAQNRTPSTFSDTGLPALDSNILLYPSTGHAAYRIVQRPLYLVNRQKPELHSRQATEHDENHDLIQFAGGALEFTLPVDWKVSELAVGREVRILLSPTEVPQRVEDLASGIWISYLHRPRQETDPAAALESQMAALWQQEARANFVARSRRTLQLGENPAVEQEFSVHDPQGRILAQGLFLIARTADGIFQFYFIAPSAHYNALRTEVNALLARIKIGSPEIPALDLPQQIASAREMIGCWKAVKSRLILTAEGRVVTLFDSKGSYALDEQGRYNFQNKVTRLTGKFHAEKDVVFIVWDDGSRLNYRWRAENGRLYLTDHLGRVSQLERLFY